MLSWIPLLGPIIQGVSSIFTGYFSKETVALQTAAQVTIAETQTSAQIIHDTNDDISLRIMRDAALVFPVIWGGLIGWDTIVSHNWPWLMFHVNNYPASVEYLPYAAYAFLFGCVGMNIWKRK